MTAAIVWLLGLAVQNLLNPGFSNRVLWKKVKATQNCEQQGLGEPPSLPKEGNLAARGSHLNED
jgi:hypothetical protein